MIQKTQRPIWIILEFERTSTSCEFSRRDWLTGLIKPVSHRNDYQRELLWVSIFSLKWVSKELGIPKPHDQSVESMDRCWWSTLGLPKNPWVTITSVMGLLGMVCSEFGHFSAFHWLSIMFHVCLQTKSDNNSIQFSQNIRIWLSPE